MAIADPILQEVIVASLALRSLLGDSSLVHTPEEFAEKASGWVIQAGLLPDRTGLVLRLQENPEQKITMTDVPVLSLPVYILYGALVVAMRDKGVEEVTVPFADLTEVVEGRKSVTPLSSLNGDGTITIRVVEEEISPATPTA